METSSSSSISTTPLICSAYNHPKQNTYNHKRAGGKQDQIRVDQDVSILDISNIRKAAEHSIEIKHSKRRRIKSPHRRISKTKEKRGHWKQRKTSKNKEGDKSPAIAPEK